LEKIVLRHMEDLSTTDGQISDGVVSVVPPLWELLALFGIIGSIASTPSIVAAFLFFIQKLKSR
jgi:hypothetical protein